MYSIIIPTYNNTIGLKECIDSIIQNTDMTEVEIIVVANGSSKDITAIIYNYWESGHMGIKLISVSKPIGYAPAINLGIKVSTGDYIILLNDDAVILDWGNKKWINILRRPFESDEVAITGPLSLPIAQLNISFLLFFCVMISRNIIDKIGLLDESFNVGAFEDADYCIRCQNAGYKLVVVPDDHVPQQDHVNKRYVCKFPIWHKAEVTVHTIPDWKNVFNNNFNKLIKKYSGR